MYGLDFTRGILQSAIPYALSTTTGNVVESLSKNTIVKLAGKILQILPTAMYLYDTLYDKVWNKLLLLKVTELNFAGKNIGSKALAWWQSVANPQKHLAFTRFWTPIITSQIASTLLFAPLILKGLKTVAHTYNCARIETWITSTDRLLMKIIKVVNLCFYAAGIHQALALTNPILIGVYSLFFLGNLYMLLSPLVKKTPSFQKG